MPSPDADIPDMTDNPLTPRGGIALFHDLTRWRQGLARAIARNNLSLTSEGIATAVNRILFSLLFLRIAEDRGFVADGTLQGISDHRDRYGRLMEVTAPLALLWDEADGVRRADAVPMGTLAVDERELDTIFIAFVARERPYGFAGMDLETVAGIIARYLSQTVRRSATHQAQVVDTHDAVLSRGGSPVPDRLILRYVAESALAAARAGRSPRELLPIRVIDPACGTGTLLLYSCRYLLDEGGALTFEERHAILMGSIHGLDISRHAVAATRMLLFFRLCEEGCLPGEPEAFLSFAGGIFRELAHTVRCGNAVISPEIEADESWAFCPAHKRHLLNAFAWNTAFPEVFASGGFDAVICNPPDGLPDRKEWILQYLQRHYQAFDPQAGRSAYFIEKGLGLLRAGGTLGCCTGNQWLRGRAGAPFRTLLSARQIEEITDIPGGSDNGICCLQLSNRPPYRRIRVIPAGPGFSTDPSAYIRSYAFYTDQNALGPGGWALRDERADMILAKVRAAGTPLEEYAMGDITRQNDLPPDPAVLIDAVTRSMLIDRDPRCRALLRPVMDAAAIRRYGPAAFTLHVIHIPGGWTRSHPQAKANPWRWFKKRHPEVARLLKERAGSTAVTGTGALWWENTGGDEMLSRICPRIFFREPFSEPAFLYDSGRAIPGSGAVAITGASPYLAGILNSRLHAFVFSKTVGSSRADRTEYLWDDIRALPVYTPDFDNPDEAGRHDRIASLVTRLHDLNRQWSCAEEAGERRRLQKMAGDTDRKIDRLVYDLYGLTPEEIALVESFTPTESLP
jgi:adenine-specific DNA-methyltransferase